MAYTLGTLFFFYAFIQRVAPSIMTGELMSEFSVGGAALGFLSGMYFYTYAAIQLPVGILNDRYGPRKLMCIAAGVCAVASCLFSYSESLTFAAVSRALIGGAVAFAFVGTLTIASTFFPRRNFALLAGLLMSVGMFGAIVGQAPLRMLMDQIGWRELFRVLAVIAIVLSVLCWFIVPKRTPGNATEKNPPKVMSGLFQVLGNRQSWLCAGMGFGLSATMLSFAGLWAVPWLVTTRGMDNTSAAAIASLLFLGLAFGSPLIGWYSDKIERRKPLLIAGTSALLVCVVLIVYSGRQNPLWLSVLFLLTGVASSVMVVCFGLVRELNQEQNNATALGLVNMFVVGAGAVMQPLIGWLLDRGWQGEFSAGARIYPEQAYNTALFSLVVVIGAACMCAFLVRESRCKSIY